MKIIKAGYELITPMNRTAVLKRIEQIGRTCYKSEDKITDESASGFVERLVRAGHEAMIEHCSITVKFICDRGVSHEIVRHRMASYAQESTRYCNYSKSKFNGELTFIEPCFWGKNTTQYWAWQRACHTAEIEYLNLLRLGASPQEARTVLPNSLKTEIVVTMNLREWRHFFQLRCSAAAHPQIREIATMLLHEFTQELPEVFGDITAYDDEKVSTQKSN